MPNSAKSIPEIAVVGAGLAGLTAAYYLARSGARVTLFERKERLGGRTFSFEDPASGIWLDNSIHIAMGCCTALSGLLTHVKAADGLKFFSAIPFLDKTGKRSVLRLDSHWNKLHPIGQMSGLLRAKFLSRSERLAVVGLFSSLAQMKSAGQRRWEGRTFAEFAASLNLPSAIVPKFLAPLLIGSLNTPYAQCDFALARTFFLTGLLRNPKSGWMGVFQGDLQHHLIQPVEAALRELGVVIRPLCSLQQVTPAKTAGGSVELGFSGNQHWRGQAVVLAIPWFETSLAPLAPAAQGLKPSPILGLHLVYDRPILADDCLGLLESPLHWLFTRPLSTGGQLISAVVSCSNAEMRVANKDLIAMADREIRTKLAVPPEIRLQSARAVKNQPATFLADPECTVLRPAPGLLPGQPGVYCAGEWTATGWPSTMEGAVRSAIMAVGALLPQVGLDRNACPEITELPRAGLMKILLTP